MWKKLLVSSLVAWILIIPLRGKWSVYGDPFDSVDRCRKVLFESRDFMKEMVENPEEGRAWIRKGEARHLSDEHADLLVQWIAEGIERGDCTTEDDPRIQLHEEDRDEREI